MKTRKYLLAARLASIALFVGAQFGHAPAQALIRPIAFPVLGPVTFSNDFGAPRAGHTHQGNDIFGLKMQPLVAAVDGRITLATFPEPSWGWAIFIRDADGYEYRYLHINNDTPGTDDGAGGGMNAFAPDMTAGNPVVRGQLIGWLGDSGNAESTRPHLHFEIRAPDGTAINPFDSLIPAEHLAGAVVPPPLPGEILAYGQFYGGAWIAAGNFDADAGPEVVTGAGPGGGPHVRTFEVSGTSFGAAHSSLLAYAPGFTGGVDVAAADVDGDGIDEIVTGAGPGGGPHVRIFKSDGRAVGGFFAYDGGFRGGVRVSAADFDGDGIDEIVTGAGPGGGPHVRIFKSDGTPIGGFFAYDGGFRGGVDVAAADVVTEPGASATATSQPEIVTGAGAGGGPHVRIFSLDGSERGGFFAYPQGFPGGVRVAAADMNNNGRAEILTGAGPSGGPHVRLLRADGSEISSRFPFNGWFNGGVDVTALPRRTFASSGPGRRASVRRGPAAP
ncbi:MAG TPA: VCBS repeat domain-containing M23 family metallopeptidase [Actinomycetota bacterium]|nr:VCBS repeat domain-containing M23 family metallopeptidase [Actinomycetota bacterium]